MVYPSLPLSQRGPYDSLTVLYLGQYLNIETQKQNSDQEILKFTVPKVHQTDPFKIFLLLFKMF